MITKSDRTYLILAAIVIAAIVLGVNFIYSRSTQPGPIDTSDDATVIDFGLVYLPVNSQISAYYDLGVNYGALVTEVSPGSLGSQSGIRVGDVIVSFNGTKLDDRTSLFGMMRRCLYGTPITLEIQRSNCLQNVEINYRSK
jgi:S1-C subfamily serine protease